MSTYTTYSFSSIDVCLVCISENHGCSSIFVVGDYDSFGDKIISKMARSYGSPKFEEK